MKTLNIVQVTLLGIIIAGQCVSSSAWCREIDMRGKWDEDVALENPHKGWYHHYPDNHINKYIIRKDSDLLDFPGMDHLYIRLAWAYLEPQEGQFNWEVIDSIIDKWVGKGLKISFRISCKETSTDRIEQQYATPKWVVEAGAKGGFYRSGKKVGPDGPWEPVFDDPVFVEKLENFLRAFARRYDGKPWLRYVDIGSIGDWGEGHTHSGSRLEYGFELRKLHIDLHLKYFNKTQLVITDDYVYSISDLKNRDKLHRYILKQGISYRDDSPLVNGYVRGYANTYTVRSPEFFKDSYLKRPTVFELQHYGAVKRDGNWEVKEGSSLSKYAKGKDGPDFFRGALDLLHATYIGYHGYAHEWLADNPDLTVELLNRCGYWLFLHHVTIPDVVQSGESYTIQLAWENRGVAPVYNPYVLKVRLAGPDNIDFEFESGCQKWLPEPAGTIYHEVYTLDIPAGLQSGLYKLKIMLYSKEEKEEVSLALNPELLDGQNFYTVTSINISSPEN
ncbi:MAG: DUF4832 domain-containing protein [Planctomycetes bacterium]|nr:DUF4832 domain-containing protein [Planctomycetota bacterium]